MNKLKLLICG